MPKICHKNIPNVKQRITPSKATELCTAASRRAREKRAGITREDIITVNNLHIRIQRITPSKATELCTAAYTIAKALKTIANAIV